MLMNRSQAKDKGEDEEDDEGDDDNGGVFIFVYFHTNLPIILNFYFAIHQAFAWFWA